MACYSWQWAADAKRPWNEDEAAATEEEGEEEEEEEENVEEEEEEEEEKEEEEDQQSGQHVTDRTAQKQKVIALDIDKVFRLAWRRVYVCPGFGL
jgi:hypothetical protein